MTQGIPAPARFTALGVILAQMRDDACEEDSLEARYVCALEGRP